MRLSPFQSQLKRLEVSLWTAGIAVGLLAEWTADAWHEPIRWLPDLVVGLAFIGAGAWAMRHNQVVGLFLVIIGFLWFAGNFVAAAVLLHRGPLIHLLLTYPGWRPVSRLSKVAVAVAYLSTIFTAGGQNDFVVIVLALALIGVVERQYVLANARDRGGRRLARSATVAFGAALILGAAGRIAFPDALISTATLIAYEIVLTGIAIGLAERLRHSSPGPMADLVIELGEHPSGGLRDALATALGDPTLQVGYWSDEDRGYTDATGTPIGEAEGARTATKIEREGRPFAVIVHDAAVLQDPGLVEGVSAATRLTALNLDLQAEVQAQVDEVSASRRRLVMAADDEQRRLEARLRSGAERRLTRIVNSLRVEASNRQSDSHLQRAVQQLGLTIADLQVLARGLHPRELNSGIGFALAGLAERCPIPTIVSIEVRRVPPEIEAAVYYLCAEALANAVKHSVGSQVSIEVSQHNEVISVEVADDGVGGADAERGAGLKGIADRIEAMGGRLTIQSPSRGGTRLAAEIPVGGEL